MAVVFTPSQLSFEHDTSPINFRISPLKLLRYDLELILSLLGYLPLVIVPFRSRNPRSELNLRSLGNVVAIILQGLLLIGTLVGFIGLVLFVFLPIPGAALVLYAGGCVTVCGPIILYLNWGPEIVISDPRLPSGRFENLSSNHEKWFFINGVMVGDHWLQSAVDELSILFHRKIYGIRNKTGGLILDLVECLIQRDFGYTTRDARVAYIHIKEALLREDMKRVVVVAHSQGGIIISLALDNLLSDLPREYFQKLEIYTFGCAANHFNNPKLSIARGSKAAIPHIEHYANAYDFVALIGALHFTHPATKDPVNRYAGRVFTRPNHSGHMFVQHYLIKMFGSDQTFLDQRITTDQQSRPLGTAEDPNKMRARGKTVRELSRFASYLGGSSCGAAD